MNKSQSSIWGAISILVLTGLVACGQSSTTEASAKNAENSLTKDPVPVSMANQGGRVNAVTIVDAKGGDKGNSSIVDEQKIVQSNGTLATEMGVMTKADDLKVEPFRDAKSIKTLAAGDKVDFISRQGGWYSVNVGKVTGWVHMLSVRKGDAKKGLDTTSGLLALSSGRAGTGKVVATTGVRGLNEEELKAATFNEAELLRAEANASSKADAAQFAKQGELVARPFNYLPAK